VGRIPRHAAATLESGGGCRRSSRPAVSGTARCSDDGSTSNGRLRPSISRSRSSSQGLVRHRLCYVAEVHLIPSTWASSPRRERPRAARAARDVVPTSQRPWGCIFGGFVDWPGNPSNAASTEAIVQGNPDTPQVCPEARFWPTWNEDASLAAPPPNRTRVEETAISGMMNLHPLYRTHRATGAQVPNVETFKPPTV
jgi:hypothetical protein